MGYKNLIGQKFGSFTVISKQPIPSYYKRHDSFWLVRCECGTEEIHHSVHLKSCQYPTCTTCKKKNYKPVAKTQIKDDLTGLTIANVIVISKVCRPLTLNTKSASRLGWWKVQCKCGEIFIENTRNLQRAQTLACKKCRSKKCVICEAIFIANNKRSKCCSHICSEKYNKISTFESFKKLHDSDKEKWKQYAKEYRQLPHVRAKKRDDSYLYMINKQKSQRIKKLLNVSNSLNKIGLTNG